MPPVFGALALRDLVFAGAACSETIGSAAGVASTGTGCLISSGAGFATAGGALFVAGAAFLGDLVLTGAAASFVGDFRSVALVAGTWLAFFLFVIVFIGNSPSAVIAAVMTSITPVPPTSKRIPQEIHGGEGMAMHKGHGSKFGRKKEEAIAALLTQRNLEEAARAIGIAPNTLLKWMKDPTFDLAYREARRATFHQSTARLQQASSAAVTTILKLLVDQNASASARIRAAQCILDHSIRSMEIEDIQARLCVLENNAVQAKLSRGD
jgi:transposase-like protein